MRDAGALIGFVAYHVVLAAPGFALLFALGLLRLRPVAVLAAAGPAIACGIAVLGPLLVTLLVVGVPVTAITALVVAAVLTVALCVVGVRRDRPDPVLDRVPDPSPRERRIERGLLALCAVYVAIAAYSSANQGVSFDNANIWSLKALGLYHYGELVPEIFRNPGFSFVHIDYPVVQPLLEASFFHALGGVDLRLWHLELWVLVGAGVWTMAWLLAPVARRWSWAIALGLLVTGPVITMITGLGNADVTGAALLGCGILSLGIWLERGGAAHAVLGALFIGAAANVKNEEVAFAAGVLVALAVAVFAGRLAARRRGLVLVAAGVIVCMLPWQLWVRGNQYATPGTPTPWSFFSKPSVLADRWHFFTEGLGQMALQLTSVSSWGLLTPAFLVMAATFFIARVSRPVVGFYVLVWLLGVLAVGYSYWVTDIFDRDGFYSRSGPRILLGVVFATAVAVAHMLAIASREVREAPPPAADPEREPAGVA